MSGKRLAYWEGSARDSAAFGFTRFRSSRHNPTTCTPAPQQGFGLLVTCLLARQQRAHPGRNRLHARSRFGSSFSQHALLPAS